MRREVAGTVWVLVTMIAILCGACAMVSVFGFITYQITDQVGP
jgi:hypothetical protein